MSKILPCVSIANLGTTADGVRLGELDSIEARPMVLHGSTVHAKVRNEKSKCYYCDDEHSPFVNMTFEGFMSQPPYLFTFPTCGERGSPSGKV